MARWQPGTASRLQEAALALFARQGFEETTVAEIAAAAGVGERTFFRHFTDKRDVVFEGQDTFLDAFLEGIAGAPDGSTAMELVAAALRSVATLFPDERRDLSRARSAIISSHHALRERESLKLSTLVTATAAALRERGVSEPAATLAAESALSVFGVAHVQWLAEGEQRSLEGLFEETLEAFVALAR